MVSNYDEQTTNVVADNSGFFEENLFEDYVNSRVHESTPLLRRASVILIIEEESGISNNKTFFLLINAFVGTGVLFLPKAFYNGGILFSIIILFVTGFLALHCMNLIVDISRELGGMSYGDIGGKIYGRRMRSIVLFSIALAQSGFCCAYYIFVAKNLRDLVMLLSNCNLILPEWVFILSQVLLFIPLSWVRKLNYFSLPCLIASIFIFLSLGYIFYFNLATIYTNGMKNDILLFNFEGFHLFVGTSLFSLEGICLILPIADSMKNPDKFNYTLRICIVTILIIFGLIGGSGYLAFGNQVSSIVFLNLPDTYLTSLIQLLYGLSIVLSFPITIYPTIQITESKLFNFSPSGRVSNAVKWKKNIYRAFLMTFLAAVAFYGSNYLDKFTSLVGCFASIPLMFIYPSLFHSYYAKSKIEKVKDWTIVIFGILSLIFNSLITIRSFFEAEDIIERDRCII